MALLTATTVLIAQTTRWRDIHTVKKKETIYSISHDYGLTVDELMQANPEMKAKDFKLKKGSTVFIPYPPTVAATPATTAPKTVATNKNDVRNRAIRLGIMLPLHNDNGDGKRMVEYYRGVLMACDSLKKEGISVEVHAWNVAENDNVKSTLNDREASRLDIIIGPLYSKHVPAMSKFAEEHGILLMIPFSINAPELYTNRNIFQVYQNPNDQNDATVRRFCEWFKDYHPIIVAMP